jgi:hypothetical protein
MGNVRDRVAEFFRRPYGIGAPLNIYMLAPSHLIRHAKTALSDPRYFVSRIRVILYQLRHSSEPWFTAEALRALKGFVNKNMHAFEWGSGKSTLWLADRLRDVVSVEHDPAWHARVQVMLNEAQVRNAHVKLADPAEYAEQIAPYPDGCFDLVIVDGADRNACIRAAASKVRPGGWIIVDNAEAAWDCSPLTGYRRIETRNGVWQTDIFIRSLEVVSH